MARDLQDPIHVLDHGFVRLVDFMGMDVSVVRAARVSYNAAWRAGEDEKSDEKLIRYLWKNGHTTPFEAVTVTFEVKAPIFVLRQWHRHRTQSYNELSARYRELPEEFYVPLTNQIGVQSTTNKQGREGMDNADLLAARHREIEAYKASCQASFLTYKSLLERGWPRELARCALPLSIYSHMFCTMNLLNLLKFFQLRLHPHAQFEIRQYAVALREIVQPIVPVCIKAFDEEQKASTS